MVYIENGFKIALLTQLKKQALINDVINSGKELTIMKCNHHDGKLVSLNTNKHEEVAIQV